MRIWDFSFESRHSIVVFMCLATTILTEALARLSTQHATAINIFSSVKKENTRVFVELGFCHSKCSILTHTHIPLASVQIYCHQKLFLSGSFVSKLNEFCTFQMISSIYLANICKSAWVKCYINKNVSSNC